MCTSTASIVTAAHLRNVGRSRRWIEACAASGSLVRLRRGVYATSAACGAVRTAAAHGGAIGCVTAARHHGLWVLDEGDDLHVWMHGDGHRYAHERSTHVEAQVESRAPDCGCVEHWDKPGPTERRHEPSVARTLRQIYACRGVEAFFVTLESALRMQKLSADEMTWLRSRLSEDGRAAINLARSDADSGLESLLRWRLRSYALEVRTQISVVGVGRVDLLIGDRLLVEADGRGNHDGASLRHKDLVRDAVAAGWGYITLRFDYAMIVHDWDLVEQAILTHVALGNHLSRGKVGA